MDMITLALAKKYTDSQRLAHITPGTKLTFDGNREGLEVFEDDESYVYISTNTYDLNCVESFVLHIGNVSGTVAKGDFYVEGVADAQELFLTDEGITVPMVLSIQGMGTVILATDASYVSEITFAETIHTIDPKYIPTLDALTLNGADGKQYTLTVDDTGALAVTAIE